MRFLIYGAGAIGGYVGGNLARAGQAVAFLARGQTAAALRADGLRLQLETGPVHLPSIAVFETPAAAFAADSYDVVVFALKSFDTAAALDELRAAAAAPPPVLCLQNGVDNEAEIERALGPGRVIAGAVTTAVARRGAGELVVERKRGVGVALDHPLSRAVLEALNRAGLNARGYASPGALKWSKLLTNLVGNATSAILDLSVAEVFGDPRLFAVEAQMLRECLAVMRARRLPVVDLPGTPVRALALAARLPAGLARPLLQRGVGAARGGKRPSFHIDLHSGRGRTEVRWLNGAVVRHGAARGVRTPVNAALTETLEALSAGRLSLDELRGRPEALLKLIKP